MPEWMKLPPRLPGAVRSFVAALTDEHPAPSGTFQSLFDASPLPLLITEADSGMIVDLNPVAEALSGYPRADVRGRTVLEFGIYRNADDRHAQMAAVAEAPAAGRDIQFRTATGQHLRLLAHSSRITLDGRDCFLTAFTNVTALGRLDDGLLAAQRMEVAGKLSGGIAHEFNNLLTVMQGHLDAMADDASHVPALRSRIDALGRAVAQATRITSGLLTFSGHYPTQASSVDLNIALDGLRSLVAGTIGETVEVRWQLQAAPATVRIAQAHVAQVLLNLALNAREAMPDGGRLTIGTRYLERADEDARASGGPWVRLHVEDTGLGMSEEVRRQAFEPFFSTKGPGRGTGLGLSICRGIAEQAGGLITVESAPGSGTTVFVYLPWVEADTTAAAPAPPPPTTPPRAAAKVVLLVEDEADVRHIVAEILRRAGHTVHAADSLAGAETVLDDLERPIDVLLTDLVLPGGSGLEVARRVRARQPEVPVLYMSGYSEAVFAGGQKVDHLLQKPFTSRTLLAALDDLFAP
ncbi:MAG: ATP-binding protein [Vicinamibacterales bacterium]